MLDIRLMGSPGEIDVAIAELRTLSKFRILKVSKPYPNRDDDRVRVHVSVEVKESAPQLSDNLAPRPGGKWPGSVIPKDFVEPGQDRKLSYGIRHVEIETADDLLAEIRWCLSNGGDFVFLFDRGKSGHGTPRRAYYLRHSEWYWEGMRPVKTALVRELIDRRAIWTNDPAKGPGSGCRRFYPTSTPESPEWMTAKQAFEFLGGNPDDRDGSVSSVDGLKQIKFSTFKSKTSEELKSFGLELSLDRKRRRQPKIGCSNLIQNQKASIPVYKFRRISPEPQRFNL